MKAPHKILRLGTWSSGTRLHCSSAPGAGISSIFTHATPDFRLLDRRYVIRNGMVI